MNDKENNETILKEIKQFYKEKLNKSSKDRSYEIFSLGSNADVIPCGGTIQVIIEDGEEITLLPSLSQRTEALKKFFSLGEVLCGKIFRRPLASSV
jgi:hypothetical protein